MSYRDLRQGYEQPIEHKPHEVSNEDKQLLEQETDSLTARLQLRVAFIKKQIERSEQHD